MTDNVPMPHPEDQHDFVRDLVPPSRSGGAAHYGAICACGWTCTDRVGKPIGFTSERDARRLVDDHIERQQPARPVPQGTEDELPDGFSPKDFAVAVGALMRDAQEAILVDMLGGLDPNDEWRRMARNAAEAAVKIAVQRGWRPVQ